MKKRSAAAKQQQLRTPRKFEMRISRFSVTCLSSPSLSRPLLRHRHTHTHTHAHTHTCARADPLFFAGQDDAGDAARGDGV